MGAASVGVACGVAEASLEAVDSLPEPSTADTTVANGTQYFYVVTAVDVSGNESTPSNEASATPQGSEVPADTVLGFGGGDGGLQDTGFTGVLANANGDEYIAGNVALDAAAGTLLITSTAGDMYKNNNTQHNALMVSIDTSQAFTIEARLLPPFGQAENYDSAGLWAGVDYTNYAKLVAAHNKSPAQIELLAEANGKPTKSKFSIGMAWADIQTLDLRLVFDPTTGSVTGFMRLNSSAAGAWTQLGSKPFGSSLQATNAGAGLLTTNFGNSTPITQTFDYFAYDATAATSTTASTAPTNLAATAGDGQVDSSGAASTRTGVAGLRPRKAPERP